MEMVLKDRDGNEILSPRLTQWDQGVPIVIRDYYETAPYVYLHFYNTTKREIYSQTPLYDSAAHTLTTEVPNQLLREPYPITAHVYIADGGSATDPGTPNKTRTVFTATIGVDPRMQPDDFEEVDNAGSISASQIQDNLREQIEDWEALLMGLYGTNTATPVTGYFDTTTQKMYSDSAMTQEIAGDQDEIYVDSITGKLYTFSNGVWTSWDQSITGAVQYCKTRADACDDAAASMHTQYQAELTTMDTTMRASFADALDGCIVRVANTAPTAATYGDETQPVITFVIGA